MMNNLQVFKNDEFGEVRTVVVNNQPYFIASDICKSLDLSNPTMAISRLDDDEKSKFNLGLSGGKTNCVNEYGLYSLILASRKPNAKKFKRWVTHEVIPTIRKTGGYVANDDMFLEYYLPNADEQTKMFFKAQLKVMESLNNKIELDKPKVLFADSVSTSQTSILVGDLAKLIKQNGVNIGQKRLFEWMRNNGYLIKRKGADWNMPTQRSMNMGLFEIKETAITHSDGHVSISKTTKVTGKGQVYFVNAFLT